MYNILGDGWGHHVAKIVKIGFAGAGSVWLFFCQSSGPRYPSPKRQPTLGLTFLEATRRGLGSPNSHPQHVVRKTPSFAGVGAGRSRPEAVRTD